MTQGTREIVRAALRSDPTIQDGERGRLLAALTTLPGGKTTRPKLIPYREAAARLGSSTRLLHRLAREGRLQKIKLPGRVRCRGILESDLEALLANPMEQSTTP